jgi:hypothetical protein
MWMAAAPMKFSTAVLDEYDNLCDRLKLETGEREFPRMAMIETSPCQVSYLNQMVVVLEGACFYLHYLNRLTFRPGDESLRTAVYDPIAFAIAQLLADMIGALPGDPEGTSSRESVLSYITARELDYAKAARFMGDDYADKSTVLGIAPGIIADMLHRPNNEPLQLIISTQLMRGMVDADWQGMIGRAEANLKRDSDARRP